jgi:two-component sensor histidine kinase
MYRYMLEGFDPDWIDNGNRNTATYTSLPPGEYTLRVQGASSAGTWNREGLSLGIQVLPPPWLTWWAFTGYALLLTLLFWVSKRIYDSYAIEKRAIKLAFKMVETEERADDEMQEQLEIHDDLVKSVYRHSVSTLDLVSQVVAIKGSCLVDSEARAASESSIRRVSALALLEDCLYYHGEFLLADLNKYTDIIISSLLGESPVEEEGITTINDVSSQPFPIEQASALAIALYELLENALQHAYEGAKGANYLHVILKAESSEAGQAYYRLTVQDNGLGIPSNIDPHMALTPGLMIVSSMARRISGKLSFKVRNGTLASIIFPRQEDA